ncbi:hypothetical protein BMF81_04440 [Nodularia spumigena UHCC 0039]|jgi:uncharacterized protein (TIGR03643 family)|uniref:TIGR03643 family protein n=2 Tax=Nodularia spumigena TaxID=70799 RepID=A0A2S0QB36_NODSP|nr:hypothetical protein NSP_23060 [Nodularia spumigena CCY9414]AVZ31584.1 hypothetical protein BMF81_04440 [Nodularia spumigena UHCC 0039]
MQEIRQNQSRKESYIKIDVDKIDKFSKSMKLPNLDTQTIDRIIEMAWEDRTPMEAIEAQFGLQEKQVIALMRQQMKESSFKMWRERVTKRKTKHLHKREFIAGRFKSQNQK